MSATTDQQANGHGELEEILATYLESVESGIIVSAEELCARHSDLADEIREFIASERELIQMAGPTVDDHASRIASIDTSRIASATDTKTFAIPATGEQPKKREIPEQFGRYRILRELGAGAMGTVFLAHDGKLERPVALKVPHYELEADSELAQRFDREAKAAAGLQHRNICSVHDVGELAGMHYLAMSYVEGEPLDESLDLKQPTESRTAAVLIAKLARALQEAHDKGVVHRDLKPANVMIDGEGEPVIMDFGLALQTDRQDQVRVTQRGTIIGTPAYMAPEQIDGDIDRVGPASDVFSLGVMFYELLTGRLPFQGGLSMIVNQILSKPPAKPSELVAGIDPAVEAICLRMLSKSPADRFDSMAEIADALEAVVAGDEVKSSAVWAELVADRETHRRRSKAWLGVAIASMILLPVGIWLSIISLRTDFGTVEVEIPPGVEGIDVQLTRGGKLVRVLDTNAGWEFEVEEGKYDVSLGRSSDQLSLDKNSLTITRDGRVRVRVTIKATKLTDVAELKLSKTIEGLPGAIHGLSLSPDGRYLVATGQRDGNGFLVAIDPRDDSLRRLDFPGAMLGEFSWLGNHELIVSKSNGTIDKIGLASFQSLSTIRIADDGFVNLASTDNGSVATLSRDGTVKILGHRLELTNRKQFPNAREIATVGGDAGLTVYVGSRDEVIAWNPAADESNRLCETSGLVRVIQPLPTRNQLLLATDQGLIELVEEATGKSVRQFRGHPAAVASLIVDPAEKQAVSGSTDGTTLVWDIDTGSIIGRAKGERGDTNRLVASWSAGKLFTGGGFYRVGFDQWKSRDKISLRQWNLPAGDSGAEEASTEALVSLLKVRSWDEAREMSWRLKQMDPNNLGHNYHLTLSLLAAGDREAYRKQSEEVVRLLKTAGPIPPSMQARLAYAVAMGEVRKEHRETLEGAIKAGLQHRWNDWNHLHAGTVYFYRIGRYDEALELSQATIGHSHDPYRACLNKLWHAMILSRSGLPREASLYREKAFSAYHELVPRDGEPVKPSDGVLLLELELVMPEAKQALAHLKSVWAIENGLPAEVAADNEQIMELARRIADNPYDASVYFERGKLTAQLGHPGPARDDFQKAAHLDADNPLYHAYTVLLSLMFAEGDHTGDHMAAIRRLKFDPSEPESAVVVRAVLAGTPENTELPDWDQLVQRLAAKYPQDWYVQHVYARWLLRKGELAIASKAIEQAVDAAEGTIEQSASELVRLQINVLLKKEDLDWAGWQKMYAEAIQLNRPPSFHWLAMFELTRLAEEFLELDERMRRLALRTTAAEGVEIIYDSLQGDQPANEFSINAATISADGSRAVFAPDKSPRLYLYQIESGLDQIAPGGEVRSLAFLGDAKHLVIGRPAGHVDVIDINASKVVKSFPRIGKVNGVAVDPAGKHLAVAYDNARCAIWDIEAEEIVSQVLLPSAGWQIDYSPDGKYLAVGVAGQRLSLFDRDLNQQRVLEDVRIAKFGWIGADQLCFNDAKHNQLANYSMKADEIVRSFDTDENPVRAFKHFAEGNVTLVSRDNGTIEAWNLDAGTRRELGRLPDCTVSHLRLSTDGRYLLAAGSRMAKNDGGSCCTIFKLPDNFVQNARGWIAEAR